MKFINKDLESVFRLYQKSSSTFQSTIFDLMNGTNETKQSKGLAYLFKDNPLLLERFLSLKKIQDAINAVPNFCFEDLKNTDYIEIFAEMNSESANPCRRDIVINFYKNNEKIFFIVIEAKSIKLDNTGSIEDQLLKYFDKQEYPHDFGLPHLGLTLTKWEERFCTTEFISITWLEVIEIIRDICKSKDIHSQLALDYYKFITEVDKSMHYYEKEVISIPAGSSIDYIKNHNVHACPDTKGYSYKDSIFMAFREKGGVMERLYKIEKTIILNPNSQSIESEIQGTEFYTQLKGYIDERKEKWHFGGDSKYRFYILSEANQVLLKHKPKASGRGHRYFTLSEIFSEA